MKQLIFVFFFCGAAPVFSQEIIKGIVVDSASFAPLPYVNIQIKNKGKGTTTDVHGNFSLFATQQDTLIFSLLGYEGFELPLFGYEAGVIRMAERATMLRSITVDDTRMNVNPYEGMFDDREAARLKARLPFYYSRAKKDKIKAGRWRDESVRVQTYINVVINNPGTKKGLMKKYALSESEYYAILTRFNETHYNVMYYLTEAELISFINRFFESEKNK